MGIPQDTILIISGVSCVGKTTIAYEILNNYSEFRRVSELDIIRTAVRTTFNYIIDDKLVDKDAIITKYNAIFESITLSDFETTKQQSKQLLPYVKEIILRQQRRHIPTIIEGAGIVPSIYFPNNRPLEWLSPHVFFVNLYLSDEQDHITRREARSNVRNYNEDGEKTKMLVLNARKEKQKILHEETLKLQKKYKNVVSIDVSNHTAHYIANHIMWLLFNYF